MRPTPPIMLEQDQMLTTEIVLVVPEGQHTEVRLDVYITGFVQNATRSKVQKAIKEGFVQVDGRFEKASYIVQPGDTIHVTLPKPPPEEAKPEAMALDILHEDEDLLVVNKPAGLVVHPAFGNWQGTLVNGLLHHTRKHLSAADGPDGQGSALRPGIVHRLDKDTSGLLVVAKHDEAHAFLARQFQRKDVERAYHAVVWGNPPREGTYTGDIGRSSSDRKRMTILRDGRGKPAVTHFRVLQTLGHLSHVEIRLETGRTHQIRVHMSEHGHPVFGDPVYGGDVVRVGSNTGHWKHRFASLFDMMPRQCLHAKTLGFVHPRTREPMRFDSPLPQEFQAVLGALRSLYHLEPGMDPDGMEDPRMDAPGL